MPQLVLGYPRVRSKLDLARLNKDHVSKDYHEFIMESYYIFSLYLHMMLNTNAKAAGVFNP